MSAPATGLAPHQAKSEPLVLVQALRALAALLVLVGHIQGFVLKTFVADGSGQRLTFAWPGGFGVDLFFCISGFIMVVSSRRMFETPNARINFLTRRALRLVPLYWIATLCFLPILLFGSKGYTGSVWQAILTSMFFLPYPTYGVDGAAVFPIHTLGWSLNYEVFFYLIFSIFIVLPLRKAVAAVCGTIVLIIIAGGLFEPQSIALRFWSQPLILEFAFGVLIGWLYSRAWRLNLPVAVGLVAAGVLWLMMDPLGMTGKAAGATTPNDMIRIVAWGLPAAFLLFAAVGFEQGRTLRAPVLDVLRHLGDSSYSLYLLHPFALIIVSKVWNRFDGLHAMGWGTYGAALLIASVGLGLASYRWLETPITAWLHQRTRTRVEREPAAAAP